MSLAYQLPRLSELKDFIVKNRHLPDVPSAKEVEEHGVPLGKMNKILLKKVEELTMYLIKMEEENRKLEERVKAIEDLD
jgi:hypothetical protein